MTAPGPVLRDRASASSAASPTASSSNAPKTLVELFAPLAGLGQDLPRLRGRGVDLRRGARPRPTRSATRSSTSFGVKPGDRVGIAMRNLPEWIVAFAADRCRSGRSRSRSTPGGPRRSSTTPSATRASRSSSATPSAWRGPSRPASAAASRSSSTRSDTLVPVPPGVERWGDVVVRGNADARRRRRPRERRDDPVHVGHDRVPEGRGLHAPLDLPGAHGLRAATARCRASCAGRRPRRRRAGRTRRASSSSCRCST